MALTVTSISELDTARVTELLDYFTQLVQESHPEVELSRGAFHDLVLYFNSVLNAAVQENVNRILQSNSLLSITENPAIADDTIVDKVLSNYNIARGGGAAATGEAVVVFNQAVSTQISSKIRLLANGQAFYPTMTYVAVAPGESTAADGYREMTPVGDGTFAIKIAVAASSVGITGNISRLVALTPDIAPSNVKAIYAANDFTDGQNALSNADYLAKLPDGLTAKTIGGRKSFAALIRAQSAFRNIRHISVIGMGDAEQKRDQRGLFPVSGGGRVDIYMQTSEVAQRSRHLLNATYVGPVAANDNTAGTVWRLAIDRETVPGFYAVTRIARNADTTSTGYEISSTNRGYSFSRDAYMPDIQNVVESEYTRYKTLVVDFIDPDVQPAKVTANTVAPYSVELVGAPLIGQVQDFLNDRDIRCRTADVIVKAAVPCFTAISFKVRRAANDTLPDTAAIKQAIVRAVSNIGFAGQLSASIISSAAHQYLTGQQTISDIDIFGRILRPDGRVIGVRDPALIAVPNDPDNLISPKTTVFYVNEDDIDISLVGVDALSGFSD
jgi:hypothetical protein